MPLAGLVFLAGFCGGCPEQAPAGPPPPTAFKPIKEKKLPPPAPVTAETPKPVAEGPLLFDLRAVSSDDVWASGLGGQALHWDGKTWHATATGTQERVSAVVAFPGEAFACTNRGALHWKAGAWSPLVGPSGCYSAWGAAVDDVWLADSRLFHWNGKSAERVPWPWGDWDDTFYKLDGRARDDLWALGRDQNSGLVLAHFDGAQWTRHAFPSRAEVAELAVLETGEVWAWTEDGLIHRDGSGALVATPAPGAGKGSLGHGPGGLWLVDRRGSLFQRVGERFIERVVGNVEGERYGVLPLAADNVLVAGKRLQHYDGSVLQPMPR